MTLTFGVEASWTFDEFRYARHCNFVWLCSVHQVQQTHPRHWLKWDMEENEARFCQNFNRKND